MRYLKVRVSMDIVLHPMGIGIRRLTWSIGNPSRCPGRILVQGKKKGTASASIRHPDGHPVCECG